MGASIEALMHEGHGIIWGNSIQCLRNRPFPQVRHTMGAFDELPPFPRMFQQCTQAGAFLFPRCIGVKSKLYRNGPGALQNHISTHLRQGLSPLARTDVGGGRSGVQGGRGSGAMGSMTCFSHSEVVEVVGALDVFWGVPETNSHLVPIMWWLTDVELCRRN